MGLPTDRHGLDEPCGSVLVFVDESYDPRVAVAGVIVEASEAPRLEAAIQRTFGELEHRHWLRGLANFEKFLRRGFHASSNPPEVRTSFVARLAELVEFKSMVIYSDGSIRPDLTAKKLQMVAVDQLAKDVIRTYASRPGITFWFESAQGLDRYVKAVVDRAARGLGRSTEEITVRFGTKRDPDLLAIPDYVLHIFNRWLQSRPSGTFAITPEDRESREIRAILGSISQARSLDNGHVIRRTHE